MGIREKEKGQCTGVASLAPAKSGPQTGGLVHLGNRDLHLNKVPGSFGRN